MSEIYNSFMDSISHMEGADLLPKLIFHEKDNEESKTPTIKDSSPPKNKLPQSVKERLQKKLADRKK